MTSSDHLAPVPVEPRVVSERLLLAGLREQEARLQAERLAAERGAILAQLTDGVVTVDPTGCVVFANAAAHRLDDALEPGQSLITPEGGGRLRAPDGRPYPAAQRPIVRALRGEAVLGADARLLRSDGAEHTVRISATPLTAEDGRLLGAVLTLRDRAAERASADRNAPPDFVFGDVAVQFQRRRVTLGGLPVALTPIEYRLLALLVRNAGRVLPTQTLLDRVWAAGEIASSGYLKVYIHRLRLKVEPAGTPHCIETVRGIGYRFARPAAQPAWERPDSDALGRA